MELTHIALLTAIALLLVIAVALLFSYIQRRQLRKALGLSSLNANTQQTKAAFQLFADTDLQLGQTFPGVSKDRRRAVARKILRDQGLIPRGDSAG
jgi:uncharacterized membrane protein